MYVCNVCLCICNVRIYVHTSVYRSQYVQCLYSSACVTFNTSDTNKEKVDSYEYASCSKMDSLHCGWVYVLWVTTWPVADCKNARRLQEHSEHNSVASRQYREGLRKMNIICHGRWCFSLQSKRAHSKLVWNIITARDTFFYFHLPKAFSKGIRVSWLTLIGTKFPNKI